MNQRIYILRESVTKITRILSGRDIRVTQQGANAYCDYDTDGRPTRVNIPYLPDDASDALINAIQGFLDHEVAHILFTDFKKMSKANNEGFGSKHNILEDAMIESRMRERFAGSGSNLSNVGKFFLDNFTTPKLTEALALGSEEKVFGVLFPAIARAWAGHTIYKEFMRDKWHLVENHVNIIGEDLVEKVAKMSNTDDTYEVAKEMHRRMKANKPPEPPQPPESNDDAEQFQKQNADSDSEDQEDGDSAPGNSSQSGSGDDSETEGGEGSCDGGDPDDGQGNADDDDEPESDSDSDDEEEEGGDGFGESQQEAPADEDEGSDDDKDGDGSRGAADADEEEDEEGGSGEVGGNESENDNEDEGPGGPSGNDSDDDGDEDEEGEHGRDTPDGEITPEELGASSVDADESEEAMEDFDSALSMLLSEETRNTVADASYSVFTTEYDSVGPWDAPDDTTGRVSDMQGRVDHMLGVIQKDLERAVCAKSSARWAPGQRRGKLNGRALSRLAVGSRHPQIADDRVFRKREERLSKDVAVSLVVDGSGSMSGENIRTACDAAYGLASVLERLGISCEILAFTTKSMPNHVTSEMRRDRANGIVWSREDALNIPIFKGFGEALNADVKRRLALYPVYGYGQTNVDGESIQIAARRLMQRPEAGKIMLVLSDGAPNGMGDRGAIRSHAKTVIRDLPKQGINLVGLGIASTAVQAYYDNSIYMGSIEELPTAVIGQLRQMLLKEISK